MYRHHQRDCDRPIGTSASHALCTCPFSRCARFLPFDMKIFIFFFHRRRRLGKIDRRDSFGYLSLYPSSSRNLDSDEKISSTKRTIVIVNWTGQSIGTRDGPTSRNVFDVVVLRKLASVSGNRSRFMVYFHEHSSKSFVVKYDTASRSVEIGRGDNNCYEMSSVSTRILLVPSSNK